MLALLFVLLLPQAASASASTCSVFPKGWYSSSNGYAVGTPPAQPNKTYVLQPDFLTCDEVNALNKYCVQRINQYRAGALKFSNGKADSKLGNPKPLLEATGNAQCQAEITLGDFALMGTCGAGAHKNAFSCKAMQGAQGQNSCCDRRVGNTYASVVQILDFCLQQMWDEGMPGYSGLTGHWLAMKNEAYLYASCGFAFAKTLTGGNMVLIEQNFASKYASNAPTYSTPTPSTRFPTFAITARPSTRIPTSMPLKKTRYPTAITTRPTAKPSTPCPTFTPMPPLLLLLPTHSPTSSLPNTTSPTLQPTTLIQFQPTSLAARCAPSFLLLVILFVLGIKI